MSSANETSGGVGVPRDLSSCLMEKSDDNDDDREGVADGGREGSGGGMWAAGGRGNIDGRPTEAGVKGAAAGAEIIRDCCSRDFFSCRHKLCSSVSLGCPEDTLLSQSSAFTGNDEADAARMGGAVFVAIISDVCFTDMTCGSGQLLHGVSSVPRPGDTTSFFFDVLLRDRTEGFSPKEKASPLTPLYTTLFPTRIWLK